jgi:arsenate reductase-like glutaredoxin family protein
LKEKVDVLFKLGRSYINRNEQKDTKKEEVEGAATKEDDPDIIEIVESDEISAEDLQDWTKNKFRGFKRVSPNTSTESKKSGTKDPENLKLRILSNNRLLRQLQLLPQPLLNQDIKLKI